MTAVDYLLARQRPDGSWSDWALPPGPSGPWVTAYVAARLPPSAAPARARAARWLLEHQAPGGGWAYNDRVDVDADSTAHAILFLAGEGVPVPADAYARLLAHQRPDGGVATFAPDLGLGSWGRSHTDVTAVAALALMTRGDPAAARALDFVRSSRRPDGLWDAYWWSTPLYATAWSLAALRAEGAHVRRLGGVRAAVAAVRAGGAFELAHQLLCLCELGARPSALARRLAADALGDGSWPSTPVLRVTDRACDAPWDVPDAGPLFADPARLFTTATALGALTQAGSAAAPRTAVRAGYGADHSVAQAGDGSASSRASSVDQRLLRGTHRSARCDRRRTRDAPRP